MSKAPWKNKGHTRKWKNPKTAQRRASRKWYRANKERINEARRERRFRFHGQGKPAEIAGLAIAKPGAPLLWLDQHGQLHREEELSAEELIRRWKEHHQE